MFSHSSFILFAEYCSIALACLNGFPFLAIKRAMTKEDNEAWNCPSQRNHRHGIRSPWGGLPCPSLVKLGHSFHIQRTSEQHWVLLSRFRAPYGNCLGSWHQAKGWHFFYPFIFLYPMIAHIWKSYALQSSISPMPRGINALYAAVLSCKIIFFQYSKVLKP